jgi:nitroimidazol reductase NimA-like FMN-containing flavoprotein (pyridoxamine 5'-phosphate oxidase superfamily)
VRGRPAAAHTDRAEVNDVHANGNDPRSGIRRRDRARSDAWIRYLFEHAHMGFLATVGDGEQPFLNSNLFVYDRHDHAIYLHTHRTGRTRDNVETRTKVAFGVGVMGRILPAAVALEFSVEYAGVVAFGTISVVHDVREAKSALHKLLDKYAPHLRSGRDYRAVTDSELMRTSVYRIDIETWSGKEKSAAADFPGAFRPTPVAVPVPVQDVEQR